MDENTTKLSGNKPMGQSHIIPNGLHGLLWVLRK